MKTKEFIKDHYPHYNNNEYIQIRIDGLIELLDDYASQFKPEIPTDKEIESIDFSHLPHMTQSGLVLIQYGMKAMRDLISKQIEK